MIMNKVYKEDIAVAVNTIPHREILSEKRILIVGGTGMIGSAIADALFVLDEVYSLGIDVIVLSRHSRHWKDKFLWRKKIKAVEGDVREYSFPDRPDIIINGAGASYPQSFYADPAGTMITAIHGMESCLEYSRNNQCRVVYISSGEVYAGGAGEKESITEKDYGCLDILMSRSCYPMGKMAAETLCASYVSQYGSDAVIARPCHTFGPTMTEKDNSAAAQFLKAASRGEDIELKSSGENLRSYAYVPDIAAGILAVTTSGIAGDAYNVASDDVATIRKFAEKCASYIGRKVIINERNEKNDKEKTPINRQVMDTEKIRALGWQSCFRISIGIEHTIECLKAGKHIASGGDL